MKVRMRVTISGTRDGADWPAKGSVVTLPDAVAVDLLRANLAEPVGEPEPERAVAAAPAEKAVRGRRKAAQ